MSENNSAYDRLLLAKANLVTIVSLLALLGVPALITLAFLAVL